MIGFFYIVLLYEFYVWVVFEGFIYFLIVIVCFYENIEKKENVFGISGYLCLIFLVNVKNFM